MSRIPDGFISELHTTSQDTEEVLRAKNRYLNNQLSLYKSQLKKASEKFTELNNQLSLYKSQLKKASEKFTELICEYRAEREIPRALIQSISNILKCEEREG